MSDREPCPWRIVDDIGGAFAMGAIGGGTYNLLWGAKNAPSGTRMQGALTSLSTRGPILGGQFAVWGGIFACCDCTITAVRQKEDPWNSIASGAVTGGILAVRAGPRAMATSMVVGGTLLALIEGMGIMINKMLNESAPSPHDMQAMGQIDPTAPPTAGGIGLAAAATAPPIPSPDAGSSSGESDSSSSSGMDPFAILAGGGGSSSSSSQSDNGSSSFDTFGSDTQFSTGDPSNGNVVSESEKGGWWPFGGATRT